MLYRFNIQLAIPEDVFNALPASTKTTFRNYVRAMKAKAVKINEGAANEEMTVVARWHQCHHDDPGSNIPCEDKEI